MSLKNLHTKYIDLYLIHFPECWPDICSQNPEGTWEDSWHVMENFYKKGILHAIGVSNFDLQKMKKLYQIATVRPAVLQNWHDPFHQDRDLIEFCIINNIQYMAYSSLGSQWMMKFGKNPIFNDPVLTSIAQIRSKSISQVVLRWILQSQIIAIPKSENKTHLIQNMRIFDWNLSSDEMEMINNLKNTY